MALADEVTLRRFRAHDLQVETKPDLTPVSEADMAAEQLIRDRVVAARPGDAVLGEEFGVEGSSNRRWIIDPIDGTKNYVRGIPVWATLLALEEDGEMRVGVCSAPALGHTWWAVRGGGAFADGSPIGVSRIHELEDAQLCYSDFKWWEEDRAAVRVRRARQARMADARLRRLLESHPRGRRRGRHRGRARRHTVGPRARCS